MIGNVIEGASVTCHLRRAVCSELERRTTTMKMRYLGSPTTPLRHRRRWFGAVLTGLAIMAATVGMNGTPALANGTVWWNNGATTANTFAQITCYPETMGVAVTGFSASTITISGQPYSGGSSQQVQFDLYVSDNGGQYTYKARSNWVRLPATYGWTMSNALPGSGISWLYGAQRNHTYRYYFRYRWYLGSATTTMPEMTVIPNVQSLRNWPTKNYVQDGLDGCAFYG